MQGDDPTCPAFEVHHRQFVEDMARERRAFLASRFARVVDTGGLAMTRPKSSTRQHYLPANADTVNWGFFSKTLKPQLDLDFGDVVTIETLTHQASDDHERTIEGDPGAESVYLWTKDKKGVFRRGAGEGDGKGLGTAPDRSWCAAPSRATSSKCASSMSRYGQAPIRSSRAWPSAATPLPIGASTTTTFSLARSARS